MLLPNIPESNQDLGHAPETDLVAVVIPEVVAAPDRDPEIEIENVTETETETEIIDIHHHRRRRLHRHHPPRVEKMIETEMIIGIVEEMNHLVIPRNRRPLPLVIVAVEDLAREVIARIVILTLLLLLLLHLAHRINMQTRKNLLHLLISWKMMTVMIHLLIFIN